MSAYRDLYLKLYDSRQCEACGIVPEVEDLEVHHRIGYHVPELPRNMVALCRSCHCRSDPQKVGEPQLPIHEEIADEFVHDPDTRMINGELVDLREWA